MLTKINQVHLLWELCSKVVIPSGVVQEICIAPDNDPAKLWILNEGTSYIQDVEQVDPVIAAWGLGLGESHVLTWIYNNPGYEAILDDRAARIRYVFHQNAGKARRTLPYATPGDEQEASYA